MSSGFFYRIARALPVHWQEWANETTRMAGRKEDGARWLALTIISCAVGAVAGAVGMGFAHPILNAWLANIAPSLQFTPLLAGIMGFGLGLFTVLAGRWLKLYYSIEERRKKVEDILPDFLLLVAGNIRAGMTSFSAFKSSTRPEFGPLSEEVKTVTARSLGTSSFGSALSAVSDNIRSKILAESVKFFLQAARSGGKVAQLLESTSTDLRRSQDLKKELESSTKTYVIFVAFVMVVATPLLMAVSVSFVELITRIQSQVSISTPQSSDSGNALGFLGSTLSISPAFLEGMAYILLAGNAILAGLFMGMIGSHKPLLGLRYTPIMLGVSIVVFILAKGVLSGLLSTP